MACQCDRILQRQLGSRPNREMGGVCGITEQDNVLVVPLFGSHAQETLPRRFSLVRRVVQQRFSLQPRLEQRFASLYRGVGVEPIEACIPPGLLIALDNERGQLAIE